MAWPQPSDQDHQTAGPLSRQTGRHWQTFGPSLGGPNWVRTSGSWTIALHGNVAANRMSSAVEELAAGNEIAASDLVSGGRIYVMLLVASLHAYGVEINPLAVATIQRLPQRTMESIRPMPGTSSPRAAIRIPSGPSSTAVPARTSRTAHPTIVVGLVSGTGRRGPVGWTEPVIDMSGSRTSGSCATLDALARGFGPRLEVNVEDPPIPGGVRELDADAVFRVLSTLLTGLMLGMRREAASIEAIGLRAEIAAGANKAPAQPSPTPPANATKTTERVPFEQLPCRRSARTSSRSDVEKSNRSRVTGHIAISPVS